ncbi:MAG: hypothetical protein U0350_19480 [Caldilineaceae bacterium]
MTLTIDAIFDGKAFLPVKPLRLEPNTHVRIVVETEPEQNEPLSFLDVAASLELEGPPDWSINLDEYLYGGKTINGA